MYPRHNIRILAVEEFVAGFVNKREGDCLPSLSVQPVLSVPLI